MQMNVMPNVELVAWNLPKGIPAPSYAYLRELFGESVTPISVATAFRRGVSAATPDGCSSRVWVYEGDLYAQLDRIHAESSLRRERIARVKVHGRTVETLEGAWEVTINQRAYVWADVSRVIMRTLQTDRGLYHVRTAGGVYFAPSRSELLNTLEQACDGCGVRFLRYIIPDSAGHRAEVAEAITAALASNLADMREACAEYTESTRPGIIERRVQSLREFSHRLASLTDLADTGDLQTDTQTLLGQLADLLGRINSAPRARRERVVSLK